MPLRPPTARDVGTLQTVPAGSGMQPPGHVETGEHHCTTRRMGPDRAAGKRSPAPNSVTGNQPIDHAPEPKATVRYMQLTAVKRGDAQLQHRI